MPSQDEIDQEVKAVGHKIKTLVAAARELGVKDGLSTAFESVFGILVANGYDVTGEKSLGMTIRFAARSFGTPINADGTRDPQG